MLYSYKEIPYKSKNGNVSCIESDGSQKYIKAKKSDTMGCILNIFTYILKKNRQNIYSIRSQMTVSLGMGGQGR